MAGEPCFIERELDGESSKNTEIAKKDIRFIKLKPLWECLLIQLTDI
jgi:hypothetical protein